MALEMTERGIGLELIQVEATKILFSELNDELDLQQEKWADRDEEWNLLTGQDPSFVELEHIEDRNFHPGHRPSLILKLPKEHYPNISVMAYSGKPTGDILDQASNFNIMLDIEAMCKSDTSEAEVDRRTHRTTEAIHQVLVRNENINGYSLGWDNDPVIQLTDIFIRSEEASHGPDWYWQAVRVRYNLTRHARIPQ